MIETKLDRVIELLEKIAVGLGAPAPAAPAKPKKEPKPVEVIAPAAAAEDPFATAAPAPAAAAPTPEPAAPVDAATLGAALVAYSKTAKTDEAGYALVADLLGKYKQANGKPVTKRSELQAADYNAVFEAAKKGTK
jgi:hypothetical protein